MQSGLTDTVWDVLRSVAHSPHVSANIPPLSANLFTDLGITSFELVDLAVALERRLGIDEFPLQDWLDGEAALGIDGYTVHSLVVACQRVATPNPAL